uniref:Ig-like domain-containing protein n=1 Tax=Neogobius melanostomus TaxID=47308 RepID=A0A8C6SN41_9GOBI
MVFSGLQDSPFFLQTIHKITIITIIIIIMMIIICIVIVNNIKGFRNYAAGRCEFNSTDPSDIQYIFASVYNKLELYRFDSKVGKFVGYTEYGVKAAEHLNNNTAWLERFRHLKYTSCVPNINVYYKDILSKSVEPYAMMHTTSSSGSERVLVCSVYGFYPKDITVTWINNHQQITTGVINTEPTADRDWTFQLHSHLEYSPRSGDQISCVVEHISLKEPMVCWTILLYKTSPGQSGLMVSEHEQLYITSQMFNNLQVWD